MIKLKKADINLTSLAMSPGIHVTVDGVEVTSRCISASVSGRTALCLKLNDDKLVRNFANRTKETLRGEVAIWFDGDEEACSNKIQLERDRGNVLDEAA